MSIATLSIERPVPALMPDGSTALGPAVPADPSSWDGVLDPETLSRARQALRTAARLKAALEVFILVDFTITLGCEWGDTPEANVVGLFGQLKGIGAIHKHLIALPLNGRRPRSPRPGGPFPHADFLRLREELPRLVRDTARALARIGIDCESFRTPDNPFWDELKFPFDPVGENVLVPTECRSDGSYHLVLSDLRDELVEFMTRLETAPTTVLLRPGPTDATISPKCGCRLSADRTNRTVTLDGETVGVDEYCAPFVAAVVAAGGGWVSTREIVTAEQLLRGFTRLDGVFKSLKRTAKGAAGLIESQPRNGYRLIPAAFLNPAE